MDFVERISSKKTEAQRIPRANVCKIEKSFEVQKHLNLINIYLSNWVNNLNQLKQREFIATFEKMLFAANVSLSVTGGLCEDF